MARVCSSLFMSSVFCLVNGIAKLSINEITQAVYSCDRIYGTLTSLNKLHSISPLKDYHENIVLPAALH